MSQTAAAIWSALPGHHSASPDNRNFNSGMDQPRSAPSFINPAFDLADILNPQSAREKRMSLDYQNSASQPNGAQGTHPSYSSDFDQAMNGLHNGAQSHSGHMPAPGFDQTDGMDLSSEQNNYEYFSPSSGPNPFGARYRTNASSSSSLGQSFGGLASEGLYPHAPSPFADSMSSFAPNHNSFDLVNSLPSSYSSGKVSPLTPNDPVIGLQNSPGFPGLGGAPNGVGKDFSSGYGDLINDRRSSNVSTGSYQSEFHDEFGNGALGLAGFPPSSTMHHFQERLRPFEPSAHFPGPAPNGQGGGVPSQLHHRPSLDMMRGVNPHATHGGVGGFDDMTPFPGMGPAADLALRIPGGVDGALERMNLQPRVGMAAATDLQSFIRCVFPRFVTKLIF